MFKNAVIICRSTICTTTKPFEIGIWRLTVPSHPSKHTVWNEWSPAQKHDGMQILDVWKTKNTKTKQLNQTKTKQLNETKQQKQKNQNNEMKQNNETKQNKTKTKQNKTKTKRLTGLAREDGLVKSFSQFGKQFVKCTKRSKCICKEGL